VATSAMCDHWKPHRQRQQRCIMSLTRQQTVRCPFGRASLFLKYIYIYLRSACTNYSRHVCVQNDWTITVIPLSLSPSLNAYAYFSYSIIHTRTMQSTWVYIIYIISYSIHICTMYGYYIHVSSIWQSWNRTHFLHKHK